LSTAIAYVAVWYDQSGNGRHATQTDTLLQPKVDWPQHQVDFKPSAYMILDGNSALLGNAVYSFVTKHGSIGNDYGGVFGIGDNADTKGINFRRTDNGYHEYWYNDDHGPFGTYAAGNVMSETYDLSNRKAYQNGALVSTRASSNRNGGNSIALLGKTTNAPVINGELFYLFFSSSVLADTDRLLLEGVCPAGYFQDETVPGDASSAVCTVCPIDTYSSSAGATECTACSTPPEAPSLARLPPITTM
jgi:hypothetical protein